MILTGFKFQEVEFIGKDITSLPDAPSANGITAAELKARFDMVPKLMIALGKYNELIDALTASGAQDVTIDEIPGLDAETVQEALALLNENVSEAAKKFTTDDTLVFEDNKLSVNTADNINENNTLPITAAAVYETVGNIEVLLQQI